MIEEADELVKFCERVGGRFTGDKEVAYCTFTRRDMRWTIGLFKNRKKYISVRVESHDRDHYYKLEPVASCTFIEPRLGVVSLVCLERQNVESPLVSSLEISYNGVKNEVSLEIHDKDFEVFISNDYRYE